MSYSRARHGKHFLVLHGLTDLKKDPFDFWLTPKGIVLICAVVILLWAGYGFGIAVWFDGIEQASQAGELFGGISALFSGLAFAGLIITLLIQRKELQLQRQEMARMVKEQAETREQVAEQTEQFRIQTDFFKIQIFEKNFFQLIDILTDHINGLALGSGEARLTGRAALERMVDEMVADLREDAKGGCADIFACYEERYRQDINDLGPIFRIFYNILKYIDGAEIQNKRYYSNLFRAQLNNAELCLLYLNGGSSYGRPKLAPLMRKYNVLKHYERGELGEIDALARGFYEGWDFLNPVRD